MKTVKTACGYRCNIRVKIKNAYFTTLLTGIFLQYGFIALNQKLPIT